MTSYGITIRSTGIVARILLTSEIKGATTLDEAIAVAQSLKDDFPNAGRVCVFEKTGIDSGGSATWALKAEADFSVSPSHAGWIMVD